MSHTYFDWESRLPTWGDGDCSFPFDPPQKYAAFEKPILTSSQLLEFEL